MKQKRDRVNGALKKAFAEKNGKSLRWAQIEAAKDSPAWRAFLAAQFPPSSAEAAGGGGEGAPMGGASDLARAGEAKESAWQILKRMEEQLETAARSGDVGLIASFTRAVREARANWERAGLHEQRLQEAAGSLVPHSHAHISVHAESSPTATNVADPVPHHAPSMAVGEEPSDDNHDTLACCGDACLAALIPGRTADLKEPRRSDQKFVMPVSLLSGLAPDGPRRPPRDVHLI